MKLKQPLSRHPADTFVPPSPPLLPFSRLLRAKALECVSLVGMAVGRERFRGDAAAVMAFMQQLASTPMDTDDPTQSYMLQVSK